MAPYEAPTTQAEFLSTLSLRRATEPQNEIIAYDNDFYPRSPCGERPSNINSSSIIAYFYPRSPCGERLTAIGLILGTAAFLSTLSLRRATHYDNYNLHCVEISIHALLAESDSIGPLIFSVQPHFYPRSPCGERQTRSKRINRDIAFLSTLSLRRATGKSNKLAGLKLVFLSTLSLRRAT